MTKLITLNSTISHSEDMLATDLDSEIIIMHVDSGQYINLKDVGSDIWRQISEPKSVSDIINTLLSEYDVAAETCEKEVMAYLDELAGADLIKIETN